MSATIQRGRVAVKSRAGCASRRFVLCDGVQQRAGRIEIQRVAELVRFRRTGRFDTSRLLARVVPAVAALAERAEQVAQRAIAEKVERLVRDLELGDLRLIRTCRRRDLAGARARPRDQAASVM